MVVSCHCQPIVRKSARVNDNYPNSALPFNLKARPLWRRVERSDCPNNQDVIFLNINHHPAAVPQKTSASKPDSYTFG
eukprot:950889-Pyramimonas_sp.AAC.1